MPCITWITQNLAVWLPHSCSNYLARVFRGIHLSIFWFSQGFYVYWGLWFTLIFWFYLCSLCYVILLLQEQFFARAILNDKRVIFNCFCHLGEVNNSCTSEEKSISGKAHKFVSSSRAYDKIIRCSEKWLSSVNRRNSRNRSIICLKSLLGSDTLAAMRCDEA